MIQGVPEKNWFSAKVLFGEIIFRRNYLRRNILVPFKQVDHEYTGYVNKREAVG